jgi:HPr kinase/phosphorylase
MEKTAMAKTKAAGTAKKEFDEVAPAKKALTVRQFLETAGQMLDLRVIAGKAGLDNLIASNEYNRPGVAFAGFLGVFSFDRIQIVGNTEVSFLRSLGRRERLRRLKPIFRYAIPCFVVTSTYPIPPEFLEVAKANHIPVLKTHLNTSRFVSRLSYVLEQEFAPSMTVHGVLLDVFGMGVLITGESGVGKSECALELIQRGHRLVADDVVILQRRSKTTIVGSSSPVTKHHMEVRGLGIINVESLFGAGAVCDEKIVDLVIALEQWQQGKEYDRLGMEDRKRTIFDVDIPEYVLPVEPGRNLSILVEVAAMNQRLKNTGFNPARTLDEQLVQRMQEMTRAQAEPKKQHRQKQR